MTDEPIQKIGIGTVQFGTHYGISNRHGQTPTEEVALILETARMFNLSVIDTASAYGNAEQVLGKFTLDGLKMVSKFMPPDDKPLITQLKQSLEHLNQENLYGYLAHRPGYLIGNMHLWDELQSFKEKGIVKKIGYSLNEPGELHRLLEAGAVPDLVQLPYNYFDQRFGASLEVLKKAGCEIHARSAFLQGLFFKKREELSLFFDDVKPLIDNLQNRVRHLAASLLMLVLQNPLIDHVIIGVETCDQLLDNLQSLHLAEPLPPINQEISETILMPSNWPAT